MIIAQWRSERREHGHPGIRDPQGAGRPLEQPEQAEAWGRYAGVVAGASEPPVSACKRLMARWASRGRMEDHTEVETAEVCGEVGV